LPYGQTFGDFLTPSNIVKTGIIPIWTPSSTAPIFDFFSTLAHRLQVRISAAREMVFFALYRFTVFIGESMKQNRGKRNTQPDVRYIQITPKSGYGKIRMFMAEGDKEHVFIELSEEDIKAFANLPFTERGIKFDPEKYPILEYIEHSIKELAPPPKHWYAVAIIPDPKTKLEKGVFVKVGLRICAFFDFVLKLPLVHFPLYGIDETEVFVGKYAKKYFPEP
jgi:hypothetical protein